MSDYLVSVSKNYYPSKEENVVKSIFSQYETVIIYSLITSFGLDFLIKDQHGGDVDTIHNVRQIGKDPEMTYKNKQNQEDYENRGKYDSRSYHSNSNYIQKRNEIRQKKKDNTLTDAYTGEKLDSSSKVDLDHVMSAKEIHDDAGRVLADLSGEELANNPTNLQPTNAHTNRTKKADTMNEYLDQYGNEYTEKQKNNMRQKDAQARKEYESKIARTYYTSPKFAKDVATSASKLGVKMGLRQAIGLVFTEIWFSVKEEFIRYDVRPGLQMDMGDFFKAIGEGVKKGFVSAKSKYKEILSQFASGAAAGIFSSIATTICNIFFTTAKNVVKIIRQAFASVVEAGKILLFNPDGYPLGERLRAATKILATGASVVLGTLVSEAIGKTPIGAIPVIGDIVKTFCGTLCTGIVSCTLLYFLDRSPIINKIVDKLNKIPTIDKNVAYFKEQALMFEKYAAELMKIDLAAFKRETSTYNLIAASITEDMSEDVLNSVFKNAMASLGITMSWEKTHDSFDSFMKDKNARMVFE